MPLPVSLVGATTAPRSETVELRATMAFAAGIDDVAPVYLDTTRPTGVVAHPMFLVGPEWPVVIEAGGLAPGVLTRAEAAVGLHLGHDVTIHRLVRPGDTLTTTATVTSVTHHRAGAFETLRLETVDEHGDPVATTDFSLLFLGVAVLDDAGSDNVDRDAEPVPSPDRARPGPPPVTDDPSTTVVRRSLGAGAAHVYTECARIWNPIHTDVAVARAAGLPDIVLHGTATLAMAVSEVIAHRADGDPTQVRRISGRFGALVTLPSTIEIRIGAPAPATDRKTPAHALVPFEVANAAGDLAVRHGVVELGPTAWSIPRARRPA